jgi:hypothetical protein
MGACKSKEKNRSQCEGSLGEGETRRPDPSVFLLAGAKVPVAYQPNNDYRPDPTGGRADRIRGQSDNGSVKAGNGRAPGAANGSPAHATTAPAANPPSAARPSIRGQIVVALYSYQGSEFGDMSFQKGDQMEIIDDS